VLVEKPMTLSVADAKLMAECAQRAGVLVMVGHTHLYSAAFRELKSRGAALGTLFETRSVGGNRGPYRLDTPVLWDWGPHDVAMCLELIDEAPHAVQARRVAAERLPEGLGEAIELALEFGQALHTYPDQQRRGISDADSRARYSAAPWCTTWLPTSWCSGRSVRPSGGAPLDSTLPLTIGRPPSAADRARRTPRCDLERGSRWSRYWPHVSYVATGRGAAVSR
jgi:predicted dehydrogenase